MQNSTLNLRAEIEKRSRLFEERFTAGDISGLLDAYYHDAAIMSPPGSPLLKGREGIAGFFNAAKTTYKSIMLELVELHEIGPVVYELGQGVLTPKDSKQETLHIRYVLIWQNFDGEWRVSMDFFAPGDL